MNSTPNRAPVRVALALGLLVGSLLIPAASSAGVDIPRPGAATISVHSAFVQVAQAGAAPATRPVSYTDEQAARGERRYNDACEECHGVDLDGGLIGGPPLRGMSFEEKFANGAPASALFMFMSALMPPDAPGRFSASAYADMMAYILKRNGFSPGEPLPSEIEALDNLTMDK